MARRSKDNRILVRIGADSRKRLARNAALEKAASDRAIRREAKKESTRQRRSLREIAKRAMQLARKLARDRATQARSEAKRREREQRNANRGDRNNGDRPKRKRPFHPRGPYATEKYTSYARRAERAKSLKGNRISATICMVNGYTVKYSGDKAVSCTCDDFTQGSWVGSAAGPFNPCKHMMAECKAKKVEVWRVQGDGINCSGCGIYPNSSLDALYAPKPTLTYNGHRSCRYCPAVQLNGGTDDLHPSMRLTLVGYAPAGTSYERRYYDPSLFTPI